MRKFGYMPAQLGQLRRGGIVDGNGAGSEERTREPNELAASPGTKAGRSVKNLLLHQRGSEPIGFLSLFSQSLKQALLSFFFRYP